MCCCVVVWWCGGCVGVCVCWSVLRVMCVEVCACVVVEWLYYSKRIIIVRWADLSDFCFR